MQKPTTRKRVKFRFGLASLFILTTIAAFLIMVLDPTTTISGRLSSDDLPVKNIAVFARSHADGEVFEVETNSWGVFRFPRVKRGVYELWIKDDNCLAPSVSEFIAEKRFSNVPEMPLSEGGKLVIRFLDLDGERIATIPRVRVRVLGSSDPSRGSIFNANPLEYLRPDSNNEIVRRVLGKTQVTVDRETFEFVARDHGIHERDVCIGPNRLIGEYVENPANGHFYLAIGGGGGDYSFAQAKELAASARYRGIQGHLVTITSEKEDRFLSEKFHRRGYSWAGATDEETEGEWKWVCGPEKGETFFSTSKNIDAYHNWANRPANWTNQSGSRANRTAASFLIEPNNRSDEEHFLMWNWGQKGSWNDWDTHRSSRYVIIEFSPETGN